MLVKRIIGIALFMIFAGNAAWAFPPPISLEDRIKDSNVVIHGEITEVIITNHVAGNKIVSLRIKALEKLKGAPPEDSFTLTFLVFPDTEENHLVRAPEKGRFVFFLNWIKVKNAQGQPGDALVLYEPRVYSIVKATEGNIRKIKLLLQK